MEGFSIEMPKPPHTYRIFVLGASAAMGIPEPAYNFGRILEVMLNEIYPETRFEVITVAMVAINSHAVLKIAEDCADYEPDLFIVYLGNNEVVGPFGPGTVLTPGSLSLPLIRANIAFKSTKTGQLIDRLADSVTPRSKKLQDWSGLEMFLEKQVRCDAPALESVYHHFEQNLTDICRVAHRSGARMILSTVGSNLKDSPPFASLHKETLSQARRQTWESIYQQGIEYESAENFSQAIQAYLAAADIDETFADLQFRMGRCYWRQQDYETARTHYQKALEYDTLRFRADEKINAVIRSVAQRLDKDGVFLVDGEAALEDNSWQRTPGRELFYEHVHLNFHGNYILARAILSRIQEILPPVPTQDRPRVLIEELCAQYLAYTGFERYYLLKYFYEEMFCDPPFTNQLYYDEFMKETGRQIRQLSICLTPSQLEESRSKYEYAINRNPQDWRLHWCYSVLLGNGPKDLKEEETQLRMVLMSNPYEPAYVALGSNLRQQERFREAREVLHELLQLKPNSIGAYVVLGRISLQRGDKQAFIEYTNRLLAIAPTSAINIYVRLADAYVSTGRRDKAIRTLQDGIEIFPREETAQAYYYLGTLLDNGGQYKEAYEQMQQALKIDPDYANDETFQKKMELLKIKLGR